MWQEFTLIQLSPLRNTHPCPCNHVTALATALPHRKITEWISTDFRVFSSVDEKWRFFCFFPLQQLTAGETHISLKYFLLIEFGRKIRSLLTNLTKEEKPSFQQHNFLFLTFYKTVTNVSSVFGAIPYNHTHFLKLVIWDTYSYIKHWKYSWCYIYFLKVLKTKKMLILIYL